MVITEANKNPIHIIGSGNFYDAILADKGAYSIYGDLISHQLDNLTTSVVDLFSGIPKHSLVFLAFNETSLNYARLEQLYLPAKLAGHKMASLLHRSAYVPPDVKIGENVHIGAYSVVGNRCTLAANILVSSQVRVENDVHIGMHGFIGPGSSIGAKTKIGRHCVIGSNVHIGEDLAIGNHCIVSRPGTVLEDSLQDGVFWEPGYQTPAFMAGAGYSFSLN